MSTDIQVATASGPQIDTKRSEAVTYKFKVTDENKEYGVLVSVNPKRRRQIRELVAYSPMWKSYSQFLNDAFIYYLDSRDGERSVEEILESTTWTGYPTKISGTLTKTLFMEIHMLVNHSHTEWDTKQEFFICAIETYLEDDTPVVVRR